MGRRKIEIKAIKDDRNRSVTFLKRKGGLFKKAHELSVLCSVDVAVIIFGHNKKLYEYSSGDINETIGRFQYYGGAHEHKGPADFAGRSNLDDDDEDDMGSPPPEDQIPHDPMPQDHRYPPHLQSQPPHMRQPAQSASPPIQNGVPYYQRNHTPQPQMISRPQSRNMGHPSNFPNRPSEYASNPASHQHHQVTQGPQAPNGYAYHANPSIYNSQGPPNQQQPYYAQPPQPQHPQIQQAYMQEGRRQSMPPAFPQHERSQQPPHAQQHQKQQQQQQQQQSQPQPPQQPPAMASPPQPKQEPQPENEPGRLAKPLPAKSRSIFTPIDDSRSLLAQHWGLGKSSDNREVKMEKENRSQSVDVSAMHPRNKPPEDITSPPRKASTMPQRNSLPSDIPAPSRGSNSAQMGAKRPRLKVQIPSEQSDGGSATAESSPRESGGTASETPAKASTDASHSSGVVLPPPSPSASAILSAGAQGPPNPFARPHPPSHNNPNNGGSFSSSNNNIETPISALPSRFVSDALLPSPSSFYPEWGLGRSGDGGSNMLPSPLTFQTPVAGNGPSFLRDEEGEKERDRERDRERKRKSPEGETGQQQGEGAAHLKRVKT
ncbi:MAG: hypothetical protein L6R36_003689 [Xanthoria steineri]|nr:MAG: hypothetical protein L6R36_003689 [Xanthoria steineri]